MTADAVDRDLFKLTHEELAAMIERLEADQATIRENGRAALNRAVAAEALLEDRFGSIAEGHFAVVELAGPVTETIRHNLSRLLADFVEKTSTRFLILGDGDHAR